MREAAPQHRTRYFNLQAEGDLMETFHLAQVLRLRRYALLALLSSLAMAGTIPLVQNIYQLHNLDLWFIVLLERPANFALYLVFSALFGASLALFAYNRAHRVCGLKNAAPGVAGTLATFFLGVCPGCASLATFLFPAIAGTAGATAATAVNTNATLFFLVSNGLVVLAIALNRGFARGAPPSPIPGTPPREVRG